MVHNGARPRRYHMRSRSKRAPQSYPPLARSPGALLEARDVSVKYGGVTAVDRVSISVERGMLVGLIGANGAGKTTLLDALTGFVGASGSVVFDGVEVLHMPPHRRTRLGMGRTWQSVELFDDLTVYENLRVA